jgi:plasmid stability protein
MASITIRKIDDSVKSKLRIRAAQNGRSMESEAREILRSELNSERSEPMNLVDLIRSHIEPLGGVELAIRARQLPRRPPNFK